MKPIWPKLLGTLFIALAVFSLIARVLAGPELSVMPVPIALIALAIGLFFLRHSRNLARDEGDRKPHA